MIEITLEIDKTVIAEVCFHRAMHLSLRSIASGLLATSVTVNAKSKPAISLRENYVMKTSRRNYGEIPLKQRWIFLSRSNV